MRETYVIGSERKSATIGFFSLECGSYHSFSFIHSFILFCANSSPPSFSSSLERIELSPAHVSIHGTDISAPRSCIRPRALPNDGRDVGRTQQSFATCLCASRQSNRTPAYARTSVDVALSSWFRPWSAIGVEWDVLFVVSFAAGLRCGSDLDIVRCRQQAALAVGLSTGQDVGSFSSVGQPRASESSSAARNDR